jgi:DNA primase
MALPPAFLEELRARTPLAALAGRRVRLQKSGRNWRGCCPFHNEKTPSFYIYEDGFHCFGCGAHGDAISFVMQTQNLPFLDAVAALAGEAGLEVPAATPQAAQAERRRHDLHAVLEAATEAYRRRLRAPQGAAGLEYLRRRGLSDATIDAFRLGWSGDGRGGLATELAREGITPALLTEAGLLRESEDGPAREFFYNRVMYPICDRRGRVISFGARLLGDGQPKYLNGPETPVFAKRQSLYGLHLARAAVRTGQTLIVVEGYMDVISLHQAGFTGAVAPLGTALSEEHLQELWSLSPAPVLCFDGDQAGRNASRRAAETALPHLAADRMLRILTLDGDEDPDSFTRTRGADAFAALLAAAPAMSEVLYGLLRDATGPLATPEQCAELSRRLDLAAGSIRDRALSWEYRKAFRARLGEDRWRMQRRTVGRPGGRPGARAAHRAPPPPSRLVPTADATTAERARTLTAILLHHPDLLADVEEAYARLALPAWLERVRAAMLEGFATLETLDSSRLLAHLHDSGLAAEVAQACAPLPMPLAQGALPDAMPAEAAALWWHIFGLFDPGGLKEEVAAARTALEQNFDARALDRLKRLCKALDDASGGSRGLEVDAPDRAAQAAEPDAWAVYAPGAGPADADETGCDATGGDETGPHPAPVAVR